MADNNTFDAIVVGSGISGGWAAKELTERGLNTIMLERGFDIKHGKDYVAQEFIPTGKTNEEKIAALKDAVRRCDV